MVDDVILNKAATIERCIRRIHEEYDGFENEFATNYTRQDAIILNIQRACEAVLDMATYMVRREKLGVPLASRDVFVLLEKQNIISVALSESLQSMVGFRNIAVHDYASLNLEIVHAVIARHLRDLQHFCQILLST